jgi:hypothetical protein
MHVFMFVYTHTYVDYKSSFVFFWLLIVMCRFFVVGAGCRENFYCRWGRCPAQSIRYRLIYGVLETNKKNFHRNQNKPKQDLFRLCFGLLRETKN